jgi:hypothetical protein
MNEKVREALERAERWMGDCTELATIRAHIEGLEARLAKIDRMAACGTAESFLALSDDDKRQWFASAVIESSERKAAEARVRELEGWRDAVLDGNAVYAALTQDQRRRTSADNVSDVLDAAAKVARIVPEGEQR